MAHPLPLRSEPTFGSNLSTSRHKARHRPTSANNKTDNSTIPMRSISRAIQPHFRVLIWRSLPLFSKNERDRERREAPLAASRRRFKYKSPGGGDRAFSLGVATLVASTLAAAAIKSGHHRLRVPARDVSSLKQVVSRVKWH